jgi:four helix bundle protein
MGIILKELKECRVALKIIRKKELIKPAAKLDSIYSETEQLIAIIAKSVVTVRKNNNPQPNPNIENH